LQFADWGTQEMCGFAIYGLIITNLWICDLQPIGSPENVFKSQQIARPQILVHFAIANPQISQVRQYANYKSANFYDQFTNRKSANFYKI
jgi:hypothetical protein